MAFVPPPELGTLLRRIEALADARGAHAYAVGGTVRDVLLGRPIRDLDVAVQGDAMALARALSDDLRGHFVPLDDANGVARVEGLYRSRNRIFRFLHR